MRRKVAEVAEVTAEEALAEGAAVRSGREGLFGVCIRGGAEVFCNPPKAWNVAI